MLKKRECGQNVAYLLDAVPLILMITKTMMMQTLSSVLNYVITHHESLRRSPVFRGFSVKVNIKALMQRERNIASFMELTKAYFKNAPLQFFILY
jgi:hypothetical protein